MASKKNDDLAVATEDEQLKAKVQPSKKEKPYVNPVQQVVEPLREFAVESSRLLNACQKPDATEFKKIAWATGVGFLVMGFVGFFVKIIHIPIHQILLGGSGGSE